MTAYAVFLVSASPAEFLVNVYFQIGLLDPIEWYSDLPISTIVKQYVVTIDAQQRPAKVPLTVNWLASLHLRLTSNKPLKIRAFVKPSFQSRGGYLQRVGGVDEVFNVENCSEMNADIGAIFVGYTVRLINENSDNRLVFGTCHFGMHEFQTVVDCHLFSQLMNAFGNRLFTHWANLGPASRPKEKVGANPPDETPCFEQAVNYRGRSVLRQPRTRRGKISCGASYLATPQAIKTMALNFHILVGYFQLILSQLKLLALTNPQHDGLGASLNRLFHTHQKQSIVLLPFVVWFFGVGNARPTLAQGPPVIISETDSTRAIAFDSVTFVKEPFALSNRFATDGRTHVMVFVLNVPVTPGVESSIAADVETANHQHHALTVENAFTVPSLPWLTALIVRLSDQLNDAGDVLLRITNRGVPSNRVRIAVDGIGGGPSDDAGAGPTPAPPYVVRGRIAVDGEGLSGVSLALTGDQTAVVTTDETGAYSLVINSFGNYTLTPTKAFFNFAPGNRVFTNLSGNQLQTNFAAARRTHTVSGRVLNDEGQGVDGVNVTVLDENNSTLHVTTTGGGGTFVFPPLPEGLIFTIAPALTPFFSFANQTLPILDADVFLNFQGARRSYTLSGRIADAASCPLSGITVNLSGGQAATTITDGEGNFGFIGVPAGRNYTVGAPETPIYTFSGAQNFNNLADNSSANFLATLKKYNVSGIVTDGTNGLANISITLNGTQSGTTTTDSNGNYMFAGLNAAGNYTISPSPTTLLQFPTQTIVSLISNQQLIFNGGLRDYTVSGSVIGTNNTRVSGVLLRLTGSRTGVTRTDANGNYSFVVKALDSFTVTPSIEQEFFSFSPNQQSFVQNTSDRIVNFNASPISFPNPPYVLEFDGSPKTVDYGNFFPAFTDLGHFFWEFWAMPGPNAGATYLVSDGYGGAHAILFGLANFSTSEPARYQLLGNLNDGITGGDHIFYFYSDQGPAVNEWGHLAVGWDGQNIITYFNGVPVGKTPYDRPRQSEGPGQGNGRLLIGGSDHSNFQGRIAQLRGYEGTNPRELQSVESSFAPETIFTPEGNLLSYYFRAAPFVADLSHGFVSGTHLGWPRGTLAGVLGDCGPCPPPQFVLDPSAPNFVTNTPAPPVSVANAPATPANALVFDSFSRANATYTFGNLGGLGSTETGNAGPLAWHTSEGATDRKLFGILNGVGVVLGNNTALTWVNTAAQTGKLDIRVSRKRGIHGSGTNTGLSFRVTDASNYFFAYTTDSIPSPGNQFITVGYYSGGVRNVIGSVLAPPDWTTLRVVTGSDGLIQVFTDSTLLGSTNNPILASATGAGLFNNGPGLGLVNRWDNFTIFRIAP